MSLSSMVLRVTDSWIAGLHLWKALPLLRKQDGAVLVVAFGLGALLNVTVAFVATIALAALLLMKRTAENLPSPGADREPSTQGDRRRSGIRTVPPGVEVFQVESVLLLGPAGPAWKALSLFRAAPRVFILAARDTTPIDGTGFEALLALQSECDRRGIHFIVCGVRTPHGSPYGGDNDFDIAADVDEALARAQTRLCLPGPAREPRGGRPGGD